MTSWLGVLRVPVRGPLRFSWNVGVVLPGWRGRFQGMETVSDFVFRLARFPMTRCDDPPPLSTSGLPPARPRSRALEPRRRETSPWVLHLSKLKRLGLFPDALKSGAEGLQSETSPAASSRPHPSEAAPRWRRNPWPAQTRQTMGNSVNRPFPARRGCHGYSKRLRAMRRCGSVGSADIFMSEIKTSRQK